MHRERRDGGAILPIPKRRSRTDSADDLTTTLAPQEKAGEAEPKERSHSKRKRWVWSGAALAVVIGIGLTVALVFRPLRTPPSGEKPTRMAMDSSKSTVPSPVAGDNLAVKPELPGSIGGESSEAGRQAGHSQSDTATKTPARPAGTGLTQGRTSRDIELADLIEAVEPAVVRIDVTMREGKAVGSGFVVSKDGLLVTNYHVIEDATNAVVRFRDGSERQVRGVQFADEKRDIAVLKIDGGQLHVLTIVALTKSLPI
jgi:ketosteroid isomerase-like protein